MKKLASAAHRSPSQVPRRPARASSSDWLAIASTPAYLDATLRLRASQGSLGDSDSTAW